MSENQSIYELAEMVSLDYPNDPAVQDLVSRVAQLAGVSNALEQARARGDNDPSVVWAAEQLKIVEHWIDYLLTEADNGA